MLKDLARKHQEADETDFYQLFGLVRYVDMTSATHATMKASFRKLVLKWHPDRNPASKKELCEIMTAKICLAKHVLEDPDLKRRYDLELRRQHKEEGGWSTMGWYGAWGWNVVAMAGGLTLIIGGAVGAAFTGGSSLGASVAGSALFSGGVRGSITMGEDADCSTTEFVKDATVGGLQGAVGGVLGCVAGPALAAASVGGRIAIAAGVGAASTGAGHVISDITDVSITEGYLGKDVKANICNAKTFDEVCTTSNLQQLGKSVAVGAVVGGAFQGLADGAKVSADMVVDDVANAGNSAAQKGGGVLMKLQRNLPELDLMPDALAEVAEEAFAYATNITASSVAAGSNDVRGSSLIERIRKINPQAVENLVDDPSKAHFMLSRTNYQQAYADTKVARLLESGWRVCSDNSLSDNWARPDWVAIYVKDSKKTQFGILVLEGGQGFFQSEPCCDELYAAKKAGLNLTKLNGDSIDTGEYLWVEITDQLFDSPQSYETKMRATHGHRYTPTHHRATLGAFYKPSLQGKQYTYYCVVPEGRAAEKTGAANQRF